MLGAKSRGVPFSWTLRRSILRASFGTILTLLALSIGSLLGGTAIVESIFMWDGVGKLAVDAIHGRDYPMIQAYVVWMAFIYVVVNLLTDIVYRIADPQIGLSCFRFVLPHCCALQPSARICVPMIRMPSSMTRLFRPRDGNTGWERTGTAGICCPGF